MENLKIKVKEILISNDFKLISCYTETNRITLNNEKIIKRLNVNIKTLNKGAVQNYKCKIYLERIKNGYFRRYKRSFK